MGCIKPHDVGYGNLLVMLDLGHDFGQHQKEFADCLDRLVKQMNEHTSLVAETRRYRLSEYRNCFVGKQLVDHVIYMARADRKETVSIGIIRANLGLKTWYKGLGFVSSGTKTFDHLPFDVQFMTYPINHS